MRIRSPSLPDRDAIAALIDRGPFRPDEKACAVELLDAALARSDTYEALVVDDADGTPVAYVCFGRTPMTAAACDIYWLVVSPEQQGKGIGGRLLAETERQLTERGVRVIRIETSSLEGQGGAVRFYERSGYRRAGHIPDFYKAGDDLITLMKPLG